jgi:hypothetical protein
VTTNTRNSNVPKIPEVGQAAPWFALPGLKPAAGRAERRAYSLSEHRGRPLILAFYPGDETLVCTRQMCAYSAGAGQFAQLGAEVWGISPQDLESHERFVGARSLMPGSASWCQASAESRQEKWPWPVGPPYAATNAPSDSAAMVGFVEAGAPCRSELNARQIAD